MSGIKNVPAEVKLRKRPYNRWQSRLDSFAWSNHTQIEIDWEALGYTSRSSCYSSLYSAIRRRRRPMRVQMEKGKIYIRKI